MAQNDVVVIVPGLIRALLDKKLIPQHCHKIVITLEPEDVMRVEWQCVATEELGETLAEVIGNWSGSD